MKTLFKTLVVVAGASAVLGGCAVYQPAPYYEQAPRVYQDVAPSRRVYSEPAPVVVQPAPVYVGPPVTFGLNFGFWGGGGHYHGHHH
jgi:hypothetical protein